MAKLGGPRKIPRPGASSAAKDREGNDQLPEDTRAASVSRRSDRDAAPPETSLAAEKRDDYWTEEFVEATDPAIIARMLNERWETIFRLTQRVADLEKWQREVRDGD